MIYQIVFSLLFLAFATLKWHRSSTSAASITRRSAAIKQQHIRQRAAAEACFKAACEEVQTSKEEAAKELEQTKEAFRAEIATYEDSLAHVKRMEEKERDAERAKDEAVTRQNEAVTRAAKLLECGDEETQKEALACVEEASITEAWTLFRRAKADREDAERAHEEHSSTHKAALAAANAEYLAKLQEAERRQAAALSRRQDMIEAADERCRKAMEDLLTTVTKAFVATVRESDALEKTRNAALQQERDEMSAKFAALKRELDDANAKCAVSNKELDDVKNTDRDGEAARWKAVVESQATQLRKLTDQKTALTRENGRLREEVTNQTEQLRELMDANKALMGENERLRDEVMNRTERFELDKEVELLVEEATTNAPP